MFYQEKLSTKKDINLLKATIGTNHLTDHIKDLCYEFQRLSVTFPFSKILISVEGSLSVQHVTVQAQLIIRRKQKYKEMHK